MTPLLIACALAALLLGVAVVLVVAGATRLSRQRGEDPEAGDWERRAQEHRNGEQR